MAGVSTMSYGDVVFIPHVTCKGGKKRDGVQVGRAFFIFSRRLLLLGELYDGFTAHLILLSFVFPHTRVPVPEKI